MKAIKRVQYLHFFANREKEIVEKDNIENTRLHSEKRRAIKEYYFHSRGQLLHLASEKEDITKATSLCV